LLIVSQITSYLNTAHFQVLNGEIRFNCSTFGSGHAGLGLNILREALWKAVEGRRTPKSLAAQKALSEQY